MRLTGGEKENIPSLAQCVQSWFGLVNLIFIIMHWNETKTPFLRALVSIPFPVGDALLMPQSPAV